MKVSRLLILLTAGLLILLIPLPARFDAPKDVHIRVEASMFSFSPNQIRVNPGDRVTVELVSMDVVHGFSVDGYEFHVEADPGQPVSGTFTADRPGAFRFRCSIACGNLHPFMLGKLQVGYNPWLARGGLLMVLAVFGAIWFWRSTPPVANETN